MGQNTSRLGLYLPGGGSTGLITPDEPADIDKINDNMTKLDADAGAYVCTSSTRPASPYNGKIIFETDTRKTLIYKSATTSWEPVDSQGKIVANAAARDALFASPVQGTKVFRTDTGATETYYAAWNASTNPGGRTPAGWYVAERSTGLVPIVPPTVAVSGGSATANSLGTVSFNAATSITLNGVFTSAYDNYLITISGKGSVADNLVLRLASGGTPDTVSSWAWGVIQMTTAALSFAGGGTSTSPVIGLTDTASGGFNANVQLYAPALVSTNKRILSIAGRTGYGYFCQGYTADTGSKDGVHIFPASGNITGKITIYGYNS